MLSDHWLSRYRLLETLTKCDGNGNGNRNGNGNGNAYDRGGYNSSFALCAVELKTGVHYFLTFALKHRLWVLVRIASLSKNKKIIIFFSKKFHFYCREKSLYIAWTCFCNVRWQPFQDVLPAINIQAVDIISSGFISFLIFCHNYDCNFVVSAVNFVTL